MPELSTILNPTLEMTNGGTKFGRAPLTSEVTAPTESNVTTIDPASTPAVTRLGVGAAADADAALLVNGQIWNPLFDDGNSGTTKTINWNTGNKHIVALTDNVTLTLTNPKDGGPYLIVLVQDSGGGNAVTWPITVLWPGGTPPTISPGANAIDLVSLLWLDDLGVYLGSFNQDFS